MDADGQREDILSTNAHPASMMLLAMEGDEIAGIGKMTKLQTAAGIFPAAVAAFYFNEYPSSYSSDKPL